MTESRNSVRKEKLARFLKDCLFVGCLKGFEHFEVYSRGREEILCTVKSTLGDSNAIYLIGGYARYNRPFVWLRSSNERYLRLATDDVTSKDVPLNLNSTNNWKKQDVEIWDILEELIQRTAGPTKIDNPFQIDFSELYALSPFQRFFLSGALVTFLKRIFEKRPSFDSLVFRDIGQLLDLHFESITHLTTSGSVLSGT